MYKILIVEDDMAIAGTVKKQIEAWGLEARCAEDFREILSLFREFQPHLVLLDITLPFYNGYYWCGEIRKISRVPIVFLSSASDNMNIVMAMNLGGDDFIAKPFDLNVLTAKLQAVLRRAYDFTPEIPALEHRGALLLPAEAVLTYRRRANQSYEKRAPHFTDAPRAEGLRRRAGRIDAAALGNGQLY